MQDRKMRTCIIDKVEYEYHICSSDINFEPGENFEFIGKGKIYKINGVDQKFKEIHRFWRRKEDRYFE